MSFWPSGDSGLGNGGGASIAELNFPIVRPRKRKPEARMKGRIDFRWLRGGGGGECSECGGGVEAFSWERRSW